MESGSISKWNLKEGDAFEVGTSIFEVETDKATVSFDATDDGFIAKILVNEREIKVIVINIEMTLLWWMCFWFVQQSVIDCVVIVS